MPHNAPHALAYHNGLHLQYITHIFIVSNNDVGFTFEMIYEANKNNKHGS